MRVISGSTVQRFNSRFNHELYSRKWSYEYIYYDKVREYCSPFDHKFDAFLSVPKDGEWNFWIDDDAFFINMDIPLNKFVMNHSTDLIFPVSPVNLSGGWTFLSSGTFFFRSTESVRNLFQEAMNLNLQKVESWWDENLYGMFTNGDQDKILYMLMNGFARMDIVPFQWFNTRPYHFSTQLEHFLVHFAGEGSAKEKAVEKFRKRWKFPDNALVAPKFLE